MEYARLKKIEQRQSGDVYMGQNKETEQKKRPPPPKWSREQQHSAVQLILNEVRNNDDNIEELAEYGTSGVRMALPYRTKLENSFGCDLSGVDVYADKKARVAAALTGTKGFVSKNKMVLGAPLDLGVTAHEMTHIYHRQHGPTGVKSTRTVGQPWDQDEELANEVEDRVVHDKPCQDLLAQLAVTGGDVPAVQQKIKVGQDERDLTPEEEEEIINAIHLFGDGKVSAMKRYEYWRDAQDRVFKFVNAKSIIYFLRSDFGGSIHDKYSFEDEIIDDHEMESNVDSGNGAKQNSDFGVNNNNSMTGINDNLTVKTGMRSRSEQWIGSRPERSVAEAPKLLNVNDDQKLERESEGLPLVACQYLGNLVLREAKKRFPLGPCNLTFDAPFRNDLLEEQRRKLAIESERKYAKMRIRQWGNRPNAIDPFFDEVKGSIVEQKEHPDIESASCGGYVAFGIGWLAKLPARWLNRVSICEFFIEDSNGRKSNADHSFLGFNVPDEVANEPVNIAKLKGSVYFVDPWIGRAFPWQKTSDEWKAFPRALGPNFEMARRDGRICVKRKAVLSLTAKQWLAA